MSRIVPPVPGSWKKREGEKNKHYFPGDQRERWTVHRIPRLLYLTPTLHSYVSNLLYATIQPLASLYTTYFIVNIHRPPPYKFASLCATQVSGLRSPSIDRVYARSAMPFSRTATLSCHDYHRRCNLAVAVIVMARHDRRSLCLSLE